METNSDHRGPGDRGALAQIGVRTLLACDLQGSTSDRQEEIFQRGTGSHLPYGGRESNLGSAAHPWGASHVGIRCFREIPSEANAGSPFCAITEKLSLRWTSSQCQRSRSAWSIASLSLVMIVDASCTSTSPSIRRAVGSSSSCGKRFHSSRHRGF